MGTALTTEHRERLRGVKSIERPSSYPRELRERGIRMVAETRCEYPSEYAAIQSGAQVEDRYPGVVAQIDPLTARAFAPCDLVRGELSSGGAIQRS
jgi:hypothetical protein